MNKLVSIITCSYNYENYIKETIESVINQTYQNWEMIIIDDGSKDNSIDVIKEYCCKDSRIKLFTHENNQNKGLIESLKLGIKNASGKYIVFLEADDYINKVYLEHKLNVFSQYHDVGLVYNDIQLIGCRNAYYKLREKVIKEIKNYWGKNDYPHYTSDVFYLRNLIPTFSCVMVKKEFLTDCDYNSLRPAWLDWWLWAQISNKTQFYYLNEILTYWRVHENSYDSTDGKFINTIEFYRELYSILNPIKSSKYKILFGIKNILRIIKYKIYYRKDRNE